MKSSTEKQQSTKPSKSNTGNRQMTKPDKGHTRMKDNDIQKQQVEPVPSASTWPTEVMAENDDNYFPVGYFTEPPRHELCSNVDGILWAFICHLKWKYKIDTSLSHLATHLHPYAATNGEGLVGFVSRHSARIRVENESISPQDELEKIDCELSNLLITILSNRVEVHMRLGDVNQ